MNLKALTQAEAAELADVDRTTIRAWQLAGMPYTPAESRGGVGRYSSAIVIHWKFWTENRRSLKQPDLPPARALAVSHALMAGTAPDAANHASFTERVAVMLKPYYPAADAIEAAGYAIGLCDAQTGAH